MLSEYISHSTARERRRRLPQNGWSMAKDATLAGRGKWSPTTMGEEKRDSLYDPSPPRSYVGQSLLHWVENYLSRLGVGSMGNVGGLDSPYVYRSGFSNDPRKTTASKFPLFSTVKTDMRRCA